jgi:hypothetical protein
MTMIRLVKFLFRAVFSAHAIALVFVGYIVRDLHGLIGSTHARPVTPDDVVFVAALLVVVLLMGWLAGNEFRSLQVRTLRRILDREREHAADMRRLNCTMIDDVLLAARNGLPVKSFPYGGRGTGDELDVAGHRIDNAARAAERAKEQAEFDLSGRL